MTKFESAVKVIPASQKAVYEKLSDLSNLEKVKDRLPQDKVKNLSFDAETLSIEVPPVGKIVLQIVAESSPRSGKSATVAPAFSFLYLPYSHLFSTDELQVSSGEKLVFHDVQSVAQCNISTAPGITSF